LPFDFELFSVLIIYFHNKLYRLVFFLYTFTKIYFEMLSKAERTSQHILETVAPVFNRLGYASTSMAEITKATCLTKGAIYGNFENKEKLALASFEYSIKRISNQIRTYTSKVKTPIEKLYALTDFYRNYHTYSRHLGGCPILNMGVDSKNNNPDLLRRVKEVIKEFQDNLVFLIKKGIDAGDIKETVDAKKYAYRIFALMEGSIFMTITMNDKSYIDDMMDFIDEMIDRELKK
jgi:TetR/AcrR family transcriptional repressor of nem operon